MQFPRYVQALSSSGKKTNWFVENPGGTVASFEPDSDFWNNYLSTSGGTVFNIFERLSPETVRPLTFDIKLKFPPGTDVDEVDDAYTGIFKQAMMQLNNIATDIGFKPSPKYPEQYTCLATTSPMVKDGLLHARIVLPYMRVNGEKLSELYNRLSTMLTAIQLGKNIEPQSSTSISKMLIPLKEKCYLIGSKAAPFTEFQYFNMNTGSPLQSYEVFRNGNHTDLNWSALISDAEPLAPALLFTTQFCSDHTSEFVDDFEFEVESKEEEINLEAISIEAYNYQQKKQQIDLYLNLVSDSRANNYSDWIDIGAAISQLSTYYKYRDIEQAINVNFDYTADGLELWKSFTARGNTFTAEDCEREWCEITAENAVTTANTIEFFAIKDNPSLYNKITSKKIDEAINASISNPTHLNVAKVFKLVYPYQFACTGVTAKDKWYYFQGVHWEPKGIEKITQAFMGSFRDVFVKKQKDVMKVRDQAYAKEDQKQALISNDEMKNLSKLLNKIGDHAFINKTIKTMASMYFAKNFTRYQNTLSYVTAFSNCVIDIRSGKAVPREGKPEDYCTLSSTLPYKKLWHNHPDVLAAKKYMREVFRDKDRRMFMYRFIASLFHGLNSDKIAPIWQGLGNNSKSVLIRLLNLAFGGYIDKISTSVLTEKRTASDSATPSLIRSKGKRLLVAQESDKHDPIRSGTLKELTGGDTLAGRELYQGGSESETIQPTFVLGLTTNHELNMIDADQAVWNRVVLIKFDSYWLKPEQCPPTYEEQFKQGRFPIDNNFDKNLPQLARGLIWLAAEYFEDYWKNGLQIPECVQMDSLKQRMNNDTYAAFANVNVEKLVVGPERLEEKETVHVDTMYELYKNWFKEQGYYSRAPPKRDFIERLSNVLGMAPVDFEWRGVRTRAHNPYAAMTLA